MLRTEGDVRLVAMADAGKSDWREQIVPRDQSVLDMIRVAFYARQVSEAVEMINYCHDQGYETMANLMAVSKITEAEIEGVLLYPLDFQEGQRYPLVIVVHGGPESHYNNGWMTGYSSWGQLLSRKGYFVWYPNYRSSTGRGVAYAKNDHGDLAGTEFDWIITLCGHADETCPNLPGTKIHKGFDDPPKLAAEMRSKEQRLVPYRRVRDEIRDYVETLPQSLKS